MGTVCENKNKKRKHEIEHSNIAVVFAQIALLRMSRKIHILRVTDIGGMQRCKLTLKSFETSSIIIIQFALFICVCVWRTHTLTQSTWPPSNDVNEKCADRLRNIQIALSFYERPSGKAIYAHMCSTSELFC